MRVDDNKRELFAFLSKFVAHNLHDSSKQLIVSYGSDVLSVPKIGENRLMPCSQEEADTRMLLHLADAGQQGLKRVMIRTVDTDVVVLAIALRDQLLVNEVWLAFGVGKNFRYIFQFMILSRNWTHTSAVGSCSFMRLQGATPSLLSLVMQRKVLGTHGHHFQKLRPHFKLCQLSHEPIP